MGVSVCEVEVLLMKDAFMEVKWDLTYYLNNTLALFLVYGAVALQKNYKSRCSFMLVMI